MKKTNITGWKDVFSFTLIQTLKSKAFIVSYVILLSLVCISMPIISLITTNSEDTETVSPINIVYVNNQTTLPQMDFSWLKGNEKMSNITFEPMQEDYDTVADRIEVGETDSVILTISDKKGMYFLDFVKATGGPVKDSSLNSLGAAVLEQFNMFRIETLRITPDQNTILQAPVTTTVTMVDASGNPIVKKDTSITMNEYWFIYGLIFIVLMVNIMASSQIATSIVTEKSTRVVEFLLTSVKPLALMIGKIIAMLTAVLLQMASMVVMVFISNKITAIFLSKGTNILSNTLPANIFQNLNTLNIIFCIISIALGLIFYASLAGLAGATVSKIEEISEGLMLFNLTNIVGVYIGFGAASSLMNGENAFVTFSFLFPLSSPFVLPGAILIGKASIPIIAGALGLQLVFIILLFMFVAKIYETLILHNGARIKMNDLFKIYKISKIA